MVFSSERYDMKKSMDLVYMLQKSWLFRVNMKKISSSKVAKKILMEFTKGTLWMEKEKAMELFNGITEKDLRGTGKKVWKVVLVYGDLQKEIIMKVSGAIIDKRVRGCLSIKLALTKENLSILWNMEKVRKSSPMEIDTSDNTKKASQMVKESTYGQMRLITKVNLWREQEMGMVNGLKKMEQSTKVIIINKIG